MPPQIDPNQIIQLIMSLLTSPPQQPDGAIAGGSSPMGPPAGAQTPDPMMSQLAQLMQMLQQGQQSQQAPQQAMNGAMGQQGAGFGAQGGRPVGS